ncbi:MAG: leucine-rich repeat domain-containing protein, partial [Candidatus Latescibacterota bacterium]
MPADNPDQEELDPLAEEMLRMLQAEADGTAGTEHRGVTSCIGLGPQAACASPEVVFGDHGLDAAVREATLTPLDEGLRADRARAVRMLDASDRGIVDLEGIQHMSQLAEVDLSGNQIADVGPLAGLTHLARLNLSGNQITGIEPLRRGKALASGAVLDLRRNPLDFDSYASGIPALMRRGVTVHCNELENRGSPGYGTHRLVAGGSRPAGSARPEEDLVLFGDEKLEGAVRAALAKPEGAVLAAEVRGLRLLRAPAKGIRSLLGMEMLTELVEIDLSGNQVRCAQPLALLSHVERLDLSHNQIQDLPLPLPSSLRQLDLRGNPLDALVLLGRVPDLLQAGVKVWFDDFEEDEGGRPGHGEPEGAAVRSPTSDGPRRPVAGSVRVVG